MWKSIKWLLRYIAKIRTISNSSIVEYRTKNIISVHTPLIHPSNMYPTTHFKGSRRSHKIFVLWGKPIWWRDPFALLNFRIYLRQPPPKTRNYVALSTRFQDQGENPCFIPISERTNGSFDIFLLVIKKSKASDTIERKRLWCCSNCTISNIFILLSFKPPFAFSRLQCRLNFRFAATDGRCQRLCIQSIM